MRCWIWVALLVQPTLLIIGCKLARLMVEDEQNNQLLRQTFYIFSKKNTKFTVTCSALAEEGDKFAPIFEASMKTFRFETP